jgi:hypothetical protein
MIIFGLSFLKNCSKDLRREHDMLHISFKYSAVCQANAEHPEKEAE